MSTIEGSSITYHVYPDEPPVVDGQPGWIISTETAYPPIAVTCSEEEAVLIATMAAVNNEEPAVVADRLGIAWAA